MNLTKAYAFSIVDSMVEAHRLAGNLDGKSGGAIYLALCNAIETVLGSVLTEDDVAWVYSEMISNGENATYCIRLLASNNQHDAELEYRSEMGRRLATKTQYVTRCFERGMITLAEFSAELFEIQALIGNLPEDYYGYEFGTGNPWNEATEAGR